MNQSCQCVRFGNFLYRFLTISAFWERVTVVIVNIFYHEDERCISFNYVTPLKSIAIGTTDTNTSLAHTLQRFKRQLLSADVSVCLQF